MIRRERTRPLGSPWGRLRVSVHPLLCAGCWRLRRPTGRRLASFPGNSFTAPMLRLALVEERSQRGCGLGRNAKPSPLFSQESQGMRGAGTWWGSSAGPPGDGACHPEQTRRFPPRLQRTEVSGVPATQAGRHKNRHTARGAEARDTPEGFHGSRGPRGGRTLGQTRAGLGNHLVSSN